jgi:hypothetical protein
MMHRAVEAVRVHREEPEHDDAHRGDRRVGDQLLHVAVALDDEVHRGQRAVDDADDGEDDHHVAHAEGAAPEVALVDGSLREERQVEAVEAVRTELQQNAGEDDGAGRRRLDVRVRQPRMERPHRHLDGEADGEGEEEEHLHRPHRDGRPERLHEHDVEGASARTLRRGEA